MVSLFRHPKLFGPIFPVVAAILLTRPFGVAFSIAFYGLFVLMKSWDNIPWKGYEPTSEDVIVATYLNSGTYWVLQIVLQIAHKGPEHGVIESLDHIHDIVPWPESPCDGVAPLHEPTHDASGKSNEELALVESQDTQQSSYGATQNQSTAPSPTGLRVIKTAVNPKLIPYNENAGYISIIRDPKEILVSGYRFWPCMAGVDHQTTPQLWLDSCLYTGGEASFAFALAKHQAECWNRRHLPNWFVLSFDDLKKDPRKQTELIAQHMGVKLSEKQLDNVVEKSSLRYMKLHDDKFGPPIMPWLIANDSSASPSLVRSGKSSGASELFTPRELDRIDQFMLEAFEKLDSDFPYRDIFCTPGHTQILQDDDRGRVSSLQVTRTWLLLIRVFNVPIVYSTFLTGAMIVSPRISLFHLLWLLGAAFLSVAAVQSFNDCEDRETDAINAPFRPIPAGLFSPAFVLFNGWFCALLVCSISLHYSGSAAAVILITFLVVRWYSMFKKITLLHHLLMPLGLALTPIYGSLIVANEVTTLTIYGALSIFFVDINMNIVGCFKDLFDGCAEDERVLPIVIGRRNAILVASFFGLVGLLMPVSAVLGGKCSWLPLLPIGFGLLLHIESRTRLFLKPTAAEGIRALKSGRLTECTAFPCLLFGVRPLGQATMTVLSLVVAAFVLQHLLKEADVPSEKDKPKSSTVDPKTPESICGPS